MALKEGQAEIQGEGPDTIRRIQWGSNSWLHLLLTIVLGELG